MLFFRYQLSCYAAAQYLSLPHIRHSTLLHVLLHFHTYVMLRCCTFSCASTHTSCYEPEQLAMLMVAKLGKEPPNNKCQKNASNGKTLPTTAVSLWSTWEEAPPTKKSSSLAGTQTLDKQWDWLKTRFPGSWIHIKTADKTSEKFGSTCKLQSGARASKAMS